MKKYKIYPAAKSPDLAQVKSIKQFPFCLIVIFSAAAKTLSNSVNVTAAYGKAYVRESFKDITNNITKFF